MSSEDDRDVSQHRSSHGEYDPSKRRKLLRACDACRKKKIKCDAHARTGSKCTHCSVNELDCLFLKDAPKRSPPKGYIEDLETRCDLLETLVLRIAPQIDLDAEVGPKFTLDTWAAIKESRPPAAPSRRLNLRGLTSAVNNGTPSPIQHHPLAGASAVPLKERSLDVMAASGSDDEDVPHRHANLNSELDTRLDTMRIADFEKRFHGKSSAVTLIQAAFSLKDEVEGVDPSQGQRTTLRTNFWKPCPWERVSAAHTGPSVTDLKFPPEDLAELLFDLCFEKALIIHPVLHRPTFDRQRAADLHKHDINFGRVYLLVCALGSRFSSDERVTLKPPKGYPPGSPPLWSSAGWKYFSQVMSVNRPVLAGAGLSDLQIAALSALYLQGTSAPHAAWLIVGIGLRFAMDIGAHREKVYGSDRPFENQLWRRAVWSLVVMDRLTSAALGRPLAVYDEEIDLGLPLEVDDEYYNSVTKTWQQPPGKISTLASFTQMIRLTGVLAFAIRTVYAINKSKAHLGYSDDWDAQKVAELNTALNEWFSELPPHLQWDARIQDPKLFDQTAILGLTYHYVQMAIHRPFIPALSGGKQGSPLAFSSLIACTRAARSASCILETRVQRCPWEISGAAVMTAFTAGTMLLVSIWGIKKTGLAIDLTGHVQDFHKCIFALQVAEKRWHIAGRVCDTMTELAYAGKVPLPPSVKVGATKKRERASDEDDATVPGFPSGGHLSNRLNPELRSSQSRDSECLASIPGVGHSRFNDWNYDIPLPPAGWSPLPSSAIPSHIPPRQHAPPMPVDMQFADVGASWSLPYGGEDQYMDPGWDNYPIGGAPIPGMNTDLARMGSLGLSGSNGDPLQELLGTLSSGGNLGSVGGVSPLTDPVSGAGSVVEGLDDGNFDLSWMQDLGLFGGSVQSTVGPELQNTLFAAPLD